MASEIRNKLQRSSLAVPILIIICIILLGGGIYAAWSLGLFSRGLPPYARTTRQESVRYGKISMGTVHRYMTAYGTVIPAPADAANPAASARITSPAGVIVAQVNCFEGQVVRKGQVLFTLDARAVDAAADRARKLLAVAQSNVDQMNKSVTESPWHQLQMIRQLAVAQGDLEVLLAEKDRLQVVAPLSGTVVVSQIRPGETLDARQQWIDIVDTRRLAVDVSISDYKMGFVKVGQQVQIELPSPLAAPPNTAASPASIPTTIPTTIPVTMPPMPRTVAGTVRLLDPQSDPATGMASLNVSIPPEAELRPGQLVKVNVVVEEHRAVLVVPSEAMVEQPDGKFVIYLVNANVANPKIVQLGLREGDMIEVVAPELLAGQVIVTTGARSISDRSRLRSIDDDD